MTSSNSNYQLTQRQLIDTMEKLTMFGSDSNSSFRKIKKNYVLLTLI